MRHSGQVQVLTTSLEYTQPGTPPVAASNADIVRAPGGCRPGKPPEG